MRRRHKHTHANHERWLVSYADFITLLFALFVMLYASSKADAEKFKALSEGMKRSFSGTNSHSTSSTNSEHQPIEKSNLASEQPAPSPLASATSANAQGSNAELEKFAQTLRQELMNQGAFPEGVEISVTDRGVIIRLLARGFYESGGAQVRQSALSIVDQMARVLGPILNENNCHVRIEGHTDNTKTVSEYFPSNWELSTARAAWLVRYFIQKWKLDPKTLEASGFADIRPIADNTTEEGRARNRRVEIVVSKL